MPPQGSAEHLKRSVRDPEAFGPFYEAHFRDVLRYLTRRSSDGHTGLDLTAETFAQAYLSRRGFRGATDEEAAAWLFRIAKRQLARYLRKGRLERRALARLGLEPPPVDSETEREIERFAQLDEIRAALGAELDGLSPAHRAALQLRVIEELPYREVARRLSISEPAARARVSRALRTLADALEQRPIREEIPA
jgi:RNA polymerase sigma factor (sigma-70 family)